MSLEKLVLSVLSLAAESNFILFGFVSPFIQLITRCRCWSPADFESRNTMRLKLALALLTLRRGAQMKMVILMGILTCSCSHFMMIEFIK